MNATLVYDGGHLSIPESMGTPTPNQLTGTPLENLGELSSRICYESLGYYPDGKPRGRSSEKLHEHILEVQNLSVYEHCVLTVCTHATWNSLVLLSCLNRKGVWVETPMDEDGNEVVEVTVNLRAVLEWERYDCPANQVGWISDWLKNTLRGYAHRLAPRIVDDPKVGNDFLDGELKTTNLSDDQAWVTLYLYGSRGFTHEQVRHRFAMSQRSTRYVDEDDSPYIEHPLITKFLDDPSIDEHNQRTVRDLIDKSIEADRRTYRELVRRLEFYNIFRGLDKQTARKQARGASRNYLGNGLASEMLFSAPVSGWKWILKQRASKFADAEIRCVYSYVLDALKASQYGDRFAEFTLVDSPDGIGQVLAT